MGGSGSGIFEPKYIIWHVADFWRQQSWILDSNSNPMNTSAFAAIPRSHLDFGALLWVWGWKYEEAEEEMREFELLEGNKR